MPDLIRRKRDQSRNLAMDVNKTCHNRVTTALDPNSFLFEVHPPFLAPTRTSSSVNLCLSWVCDPLSVSIFSPTFLNLLHNLSFRPPSPSSNLSSQSLSGAALPAATNPSQPLLHLSTLNDKSMATFAMTFLHNP